MPDSVVVWSHLFFLVELEYTCTNGRRQTLLIKWASNACRELAIYGVICLGALKPRPHDDSISMCLHLIRTEMVQYAMLCYCMIVIHTPT